MELHLIALPRAHVLSCFDSPRSQRMEMPGDPFSSLSGGHVPILVDTNPEATIPADVKLFAPTSFLPHLGDSSCLCSDCGLRKITEHELRPLCLPPIRKVFIQQSAPTPVFFLVGHYKTWLLLSPSTREFLPGTPIFAQPTSNLWGEREGRCVCVARVSPSNPEAGVGVLISVPHIHGHILSRSVALHQIPVWVRRPYL